MTETKASAAQRLLFVEGGAYAFIEVSQQAVTLLTLPIFFFFLTVEDFGVITSAVVISQITMFLSTVGLDFSLLRLFYVWHEEERVRLASGVFCLTSAWSLAVAVASVAIIDVSFAGTPYRGPFILGALSGLVLGVRNVPLSLLRLKGETRMYATAEIGGAVGRGISQVFLVSIGLGSAGYMAGYALAPALSLLILIFAGPCWLDWRRARWLLPSDVWIYTAKVLPSLIFNRFLAVIDRVILFKWSDFDGLGLYGAASRFSSSLKLLTGGFKMAVAPVLSRSESDADSFREVYSRLSRLLLLTMLFVGSALMLAAWFVRYTPWAENWIHMQRLVGVLLLGQFLGGVALMLQMAHYYSPRPHTVSLASGGSAFALVGALIVLVPRYGAMGAAVAQLISGGMNIAILVAIDIRKGELRDWHEFLGLTALFLPVIGGMWIFDGRYQLAFLLPAFLIYGTVMAATIMRFWPPKPALL
jgi:O-antigen/teichoic acid export membrane protein